MNTNQIPISPINVAALLAELVSTATDQGFQCERIGETANFPLMALCKRTVGPRPRIYLSAGIHGDEPAPPQVLLEMLKTGAFDTRANWFICPVINPEGLHFGTREDTLCRDLNRDYLDRLSPEVQAHTAWLQKQPPFQLTLCLHEDWEASGFYLYELNRKNQPSFAPAIISAVRPMMPIEASSLIDGRPVDEPGIIRPVSDPLLRTNWPEAIYLCQEHTTLSYTLETPSSFPLSERIEAMISAVKAAVNAVNLG